VQFKKIYLILFLIIFSPLNLLAGLRCDLLKHLDNPTLYNNQKFWDEYAALSGNGKLNDRTLTELLKKNGVDASPPAAPVASLSAEVNNRFNFSTTKRADKEISGLAPSIRKHYEEFLGIMVDRSGIKKLYANPGKWRMEEMHTKDHYTVRLSEGIRVLFKMENNDLTVLQVNADKIHKF